tara:strand:+ start:220 stop:1113 length:894 start_codon:yes stop_codon:yes gene_type:complete
MGFDGFIWFMGVVEDRRDPMCLGRCKVRIAGLHTEKMELGVEEGIPVTDLPWAHPMQPITSAAMNGIGTTPLGPVEGTWVVGFFRDGEACQEPIMMGTLGGYPTKPPAKTGFNDPNGIYPKATHLNEPDTHRRARKDFEGPPDTGGGSSKVEEGLPMENYKAQYPFNHVRASESGHVEEWDDTPGAERLLRYHKSGTYEELDADGNRMLVVQMDDHQIIFGDGIIQITGDLEFEVEGDIKFGAGGKITFESGDEVAIESGAAVNIDSLDDCTITSAKGVTTEAGTLNWVKGAGLKLN